MSGLVDEVGVNRSLGNPGAALELGVVSFAGSGLLSFVVVMRLGVFVSSLNLCEFSQSVRVFFPCLKTRGHGFSAVH